jgi:hypothetical protein
MTIALSRDRIKARDISGEGIQVFLRLMPIVGLLFTFFLVRVHEIEGQLPYFVDELRHISRARIVYQFTDLQASTTPGKFLLYYWLGLFDIPLNQPGWLGRTPVALFSMLGAAGTVALARTLFSKRVALLSLLLLIFLPFMLFYERLALSDPLGASLTVIVAWWSLAYVRRPTRQRAIILAALLTLMLMAKILSGPMLLLPAMAMLLFNGETVVSVSKKTFLQVFTVVRSNWSTIRLIFLIVGGIWLFLMIVYQIRDHLNPDETDGIVDGYLFGGVRNAFIDTETKPSQIWRENADRIAQIFWYLWGPLWVGIGLLSIPFLWKSHRRQVLYLTVPTVVFWLIVFFVAGELSTRYVVIPGHLMVILLAAGLITLGEHFPSPGPLVLPVSIIGIWLFMQGVPFFTTLISTPENLELPDRDRYEYFANQTGYGMRDGLFAVSEMPNISDSSDVPVVYGLVRGCPFLPTHIPNGLPITIECSKYSNWTRVDLPGLQQRYSDLTELTEVYGRFYLLMEEFEHGQIIEKYYLKAQLTYITTFRRPYEGVPINLYIVSPREWQMSGDQPIEALTEGS